MAKKTTKSSPTSVDDSATPTPATPTPATPTPATPTVVKKETTIANDRFYFIDPENRTEEQKKAKRLAPQAQVIVNTLQAAGADGISRADLCKNLTGVLTTRQPVGRIVTYYQKELLAGGFMRIEKPVTENVTPEEVS